MWQTDREKNPFWNDSKKRSWIFQILITGSVLFLIYYLYSNAQQNLARQNMASGFSFLNREAGFEISESMIDYFSGNTYLRAFIAGALNTLKVAFIGNILALLVGLLVGIAGLSKNWLVKKMSVIYIESFRNIPLLLQLFFWYAIFTEILPGVRQSISLLPGVFLCNRGLIFPVPQAHFIYWPMFFGFLAGVLSTTFLYFWSKKRQHRTGKRFPLFFVSLVLIIAMPLIIWFIGGAPTTLVVPILKGFNFQGGYTISPEFSSLLLGLVLYTGAFNAEIVRSGIESVSQGQWEAAQSLGLPPSNVMTLVILPQAFRVIIPPLTSQLLNLTKNSSLAVAIGYPDFVSVANTAMNQAGPAVEIVGIIMLLYLTLSLLTSAVMNWYNKKMTLVEG